MRHQWIFGGGLVIGDWCNIHLRAVLELTHSGRPPKLDPKMKFHTNTQRGNIVHFGQGISSRSLNRLAAAIDSSKTASTDCDSEYITRVKMIEFAYITTLLVNCTSTTMVSYRMETHKVNKRHGKL